MNDPQNDRLDKIVSLMRSDDSVDAPAESIKWAKNIFRTRHRQPSIVKRLVAALQLDLRPDVAAAGERSDGAATARQMLFNAGEHAIDLRVEAENSHVKVRGQVLGVGFAGGTVTLSTSDIVRTAEINEMSEFGFEHVPKGYYDLELASAEREIVIEAVDL
jgi:hypothetical protein